MRTVVKKTFSILIYKLIKRNRKLFLYLNVPVTMAVTNENYMEMMDKNFESRNIQSKNSEIPIPNEQDNLIAVTEEINRKNRNEQKEYYGNELEEYSNMGVISKPPKPGWKGKLDIIVSFMEIWKLLYIVQNFQCYPDNLFTYLFCRKAS